ncbi:MAG TPA: tetratricopeptide repeat protein [Thermoanaerobaculia bacterium]
MSLLSFLSFRGRRRAHKLYDEGRALIASREYERALAVGRKLRKVQYSGAYEIEGLAYQGLGRLDDAVRVLREGVAQAPGVWLIWSLLGNCLSDLGRFDEALEAYDRAEGCAHVEHALVHLNRAVVATRQEKPLLVLEHLERVEGYRFECAALRATALHALGRNHEAEHLAMRTLEAWLTTDQSRATADAGELALVLGEIRHERGEDPAALRSAMIQWWRDTKHERLLWLIRELRPGSSPDARYFRVRILASFPRFTYPELDVVGFWMSGDAVADTVEEALSSILELQPAPAEAKIELEEVLDMEPRPHGSKGVYALTGRIFYTEE